MGTSINSFFANDVVWDPTSLERRLNELCATCATAVEAVRNGGQFSRADGAWYVVRGEAEPAKPEYLFGEGPAGLSIFVYRRVICLGSAERFGALYEESYGLAAPLRRLLCSLAASLSQPTAVAVAAAGMGDMDRAADVAYYQDGSFDDVCRELQHVAGDPTDDWDRLGEAGWYLGPTNRVGASLIIRYSTLGKVPIEAAVNTLAQVLEYRYKTSKPPSWPPADIVTKLFFANLFLGAAFEGIGAASDHLLASAENEVAAIRGRFKMSGGSPEQAVAYFNGWAAGRVTNSELRARLSNLEQFTPYLNTIFGDGAGMNLVNEFSKAFVYAFSGDSLEGQN